MNYHSYFLVLKILFLMPSSLAAGVQAEELNPPALSTAKSRITENQMKSWHIEWRALSDAKRYEIQIAQDKEFKNILSIMRTPETIIEWKIRNVGTYYWRVCGIEEDGTRGYFSAVAIVRVTATPRISFSISPMPMPLESNKSIQYKSRDFQPTEDIFALGGRGFESWCLMGDSQGGVPSRSMVTSTLAGNVGLHAGHFTPTLYAEYSLTNQVTAPSSVQNQNTSGTGYLAGIELRWQPSKFWVSGSYLFLGQYQLSQQTIFSETSIYSQPIGFGIVLGYEFSQKLSFFLALRQLTYTNWNIGSISNDKISQTSLGVGINYDFQ